MNEQEKKYNVTALVAIYIMLVVAIPLFGAKGSVVNTVLKAGLLAVLLLVSFFWSGFRLYLSPSGIIAVVLFFVSQMLCFIFADGFSIMSPAVQFAVLFVTLLVIPLIKTDEKQIKIGIALFLTFNFAAVIYNYIKHFKDIVTLNFIKGINYRMYSFFDNKNTYGMMLFVGFVLLFYMYNLGGFKRKWFFWTLFFIQLLSISISRCRTSLLCSSVFLIMYFFCGTVGKRFKLPIALLLITGIAVAFMLPVTKNYILYNIVRIDVDTYRDVIYEGGRELIAQSPIFGYGVDNWSDVLVELGGSIYSHNGYNQVLLNGGAIYMIGYVCVFIFALKNAKNLWRTNKEISKLAVLFLISVLIYSYFEATVLCGSSAANYSFTFAGIIIPAVLLNAKAQEDELL